MVIHICHYCRKARATKDWVDDITGFHVHSCGSCFKEIWGFLNDLVS